MHKDIALKWADALLSGDYSQGSNFLRGQNNDFCCLGVLCNLHAQSHPEIAEKEVDPSRYLGALHYLPEQVEFWADMKSNKGSSSIYINGRSYSSLADANDRGVSFRDIANWIKNNYEKLRIMKQILLSIAGAMLATSVFAGVVVVPARPVIVPARPAIVTPPAPAPKPAVPAPKPATPTPSDPIMTPRPIITPIIVPQPARAASGVERKRQ